MIKILQGRFHQYRNHGLPEARFIKGRRNRDQTANTCWIIEKGWEFQEKICFIDYMKVFDDMDHNRLWKNFKEMRIPDYLTCFLRNMYAGQEVTELDMERWNC